MRQILMGCQIVFQRSILGTGATWIALAVASKIKKGATKPLPLGLN
jgi:hypothetical protein